ncbi:MAG: metalloregulator ArsR/SmtB family transcription factor [Phycisphaerales bacterium]
MPPSLRDSSVTEWLSTLSDLTRLRLLRLLECDELSVGELATILQLPQSTASRHLKTLFENGWIARRSIGTAGRYRFVVDDLPEAAASLWALTREQLGDTPQIRQDLNRLDEILSGREIDTASYFGSVGAEWDAIRAALFGRSFFEHALLGLLPAEWIVADLGCGTGELTAKLAPHVRKVLAVDMSSAMLDAARNRLAEVSNVFFHEADLLELPFPEGAADAAVISLVLHHIEDPEQAIAEAGRIVKSGGRMLIIDMLEHDRDEYRHTMGHRWLGFAEEVAPGWLSEAGFSDVRLWRLPGEPDSKGPELFACAGTKASTTGRRG